MDAVLPRNVLFLMAVRQARLVRRSQYILKNFLWAALQTIQVYLMWTYLSTYNNKFALCLHALLYFTDLYRMTLDRNGCALLFASVVVTILMFFHVKYLFGTLFLMTFLSTFLMLYCDFLTSMIQKAYCDIALAISVCSNFKQASFCTDMTFIAMYAYNSNLQLNKTVEDILLYIIYACHFITFNYNIFDELNLYYLTALTSVYMYLKSLRCPRTRNVFGLAQIVI